jgi:uncharacterized membrane protein HdeD (DUF308 family)
VLGVLAIVVPVLGDHRGRDLDRLAVLYHRHRRLDHHLHDAQCTRVLVVAASAVLGIVAGIVLLVWPILGAVSLTLLLIVFFTIEGVASIMYALEHKKELSGRWTWMIVSGIVDLIMAFIIVTGLPGTAAWALGLLVGIDMLFGGTSMIAMALHARSSDNTGVRAPARVRGA